MSKILDRWEEARNTLLWRSSRSFAKCIHINHLTPKEHFCFYVFLVTVCIAVTFTAHYSHTGFDWPKPQCQLPTSLGGKLVDVNLGWRGWGAGQPARHVGITLLHWGYGGGGVAVNPDSTNSLLFLTIQFCADSEQVIIFNIVYGKNMENSWEIQSTRKLKRRHFNDYNTRYRFGTPIL